MRPIAGGLLLQQRDLIDAPGDDPASWTLATGDSGPGDAGRSRVRLAGLPRGEVERDPARAGGAAVGIGMGQVNRVDSAHLAVARAGDRARGAVAASDAFFPFPDGLEVLLEAGVRAVVQPGGSVRDNLVVEAAARGGCAPVPDRDAPLRALTRVPSEEQHSAPAVERDCLAAYDSNISSNAAFPAASAFPGGVRGRGVGGRCLGRLEDRR